MLYYDLFCGRLEENQYCVGLFDFNVPVDIQLENTGGNWIHLRCPFHYRGLE